VFLGLRTRKTVQVVETSWQASEKFSLATRPARTINMRRVAFFCLLSCLALAGCEKPELIRYPGESLPGSVANSAPSVSAGADVTLPWPADSVQLTASATDDGQPQTLRITWTATPGGVQFDNAMTAQTAARFAAPGTYTLTLTADDGALQASDSLVVTVTEASANTPPVISAGADVATELPLITKLHGTATDDGVPTSPLTIAWSVVSGPGAVEFASTSAADTTATFAVVGTYELQLSANDGALTSTDTVTVTVAPAVYPAPDLSETDPDRGWLRVTPETVGMDAAPLVAAETYALKAGGSGIISRHGRIVHSWGGLDLPRYDIKSATKSIGAIALGLALDDNLVRIDERASTYLPDFGAPNPPADVQGITLLQLATHTSGFAKSPSYHPLLADRPFWRYSDGALNWLADALTTVYNQDLEQLFIARVYSVLGVNERDDIQWRERTQVAVPEHREFSAGMVVNVNTMARVGLLYLRRGEWEGGRRVFSASFTDLVRTPRAENAGIPVAPTDAPNFPEANLRYGVLWWTNATGALPNVPRDAYWAWGLGDSLIVVIPSLDLVIARAGPTTTVPASQRVFGGSTWNSDYAVLAPFLDPIVAAVRD
jgi:CubicO group peptidase (beta-lactamase class C family)